MLRPITWKNKVLASIGYMAMVKHQLRRLSLGKLANPNVAPALALLEQQLDTQVRTWRYRRWVRGLAG
jgi:2,4-dienoyl-CoA reductase (NADPH2)